MLILSKELHESSVNLPILNISHHAYKIRHGFLHLSVVPLNLTSPSLPLNKIFISADLDTDMSVGINYGWAHHKTHTKPLIFNMSRFDDWILLIQVSIDANKASVDDNKEDLDDKMKKLWEIFDKIIENVNHLYHLYIISSQYNDVEDDGILVITKSTSKNKTYKSYPSSF